MEVEATGVPHGGIHTHTIGRDPNSGGGLHRVVVIVSIQIQDFIVYPIPMNVVSVMTPATL